LIQTERYAVTGWSERFPGLHEGENARSQQSLIIFLALGVTAAKFGFKEELSGSEIYYPSHNS
jgi:hypothetical protein